MTEQAPLCSYWLQGACARGDACTFRHSGFVADEGIAGQVSGSPRWCCSLGADAGFSQPSAPEPN